MQCFFIKKYIQRQEQEVGLRKQSHSIYSNFLFIVRTIRISNVLTQIAAVSVYKDTYIFSHDPKGPEEMNFWLK